MNEPDHSEFNHLDTLNNDLLNKFINDIIENYTHGYKDKSILNLKWQTHDTLYIMGVNEHIDFYIGYSTPQDYKTMRKPTTKHDLNEENFERLKTIYSIYSL